MDIDKIVEDLLDKGCRFMFIQVCITEFWTTAFTDETGLTEYFREVLLVVVFPYLPVLLLFL